MLKVEWAMEVCARQEDWTGGHSEMEEPEHPRQHHTHFWSGGGKIAESSREWRKMDGVSVGDTSRDNELD